MKNNLRVREEYKLNTSQESNLLQKSQILFCEQKNRWTDKYGDLGVTGKASFRVFLPTKGQANPLWEQQEDGRIREETLKRVWRLRGDVAGTLLRENVC